MKYKTNSLVMLSFIKILFKITFYFYCRFLIKFHLIIFCCFPLIKISLWYYKEKISLIKALKVSCGFLNFDYRKTDYAKSRRERCNKLIPPHFYTNSDSKKMNTQASEELLLAFIYQSATSALDWSCLLKVKVNKRDYVK